MRAKRAPMAALWVVAAAYGLAGCAGGASNPVVGVIAPAPGGVEVGSTAPDANFFDGAGASRRLSSLYGDATLIVFVDGSCATPVSELEEAGDAAVRGMRIVAVFTDCALSEAECVEALQGRSASVVSLCDGRGLLSRRYGIPEHSSAVFVLDASGRVVERGSLSDLPSLTRRAQRTAYSVADARARLYGGN